MAYILNNPSFYPSTSRVVEDDYYVCSKDTDGVERCYLKDVVKDVVVNYEDILRSRVFLLSLLVVLAVFGLLFMVEVYWGWSLLIGFIAGAVFWNVYKKRYP